MHLVRGSSRPRSWRRHRHRQSAQRLPVKAEVIILLRGHYLLDDWCVYDAG